MDRHNRKLMMMISDLIAGSATVAVLLLQAFGALQVWHLYAAAIFQGLGNAFQWPAYSAAISTMIPKEKLGRANGMMSLIEMGPGVLAPMLAGANQTLDRGERMKRLAACEERLLRAMPLIPMFFDSWAYLCKPFMRGLTSNLFDTRAFKYAWIDMDWKPA